MREKLERDLVVLGGGPGGYSAAFRAADLGRSVTLVEKDAVLGGVCLNVGCIPSKTLLHVTGVLEETERLRAAGVTFGNVSVDLQQLKAHKEGIIDTLTSGLDDLCKARSVERLEGYGSFLSERSLLVKTGNKELEIEFDDIIIATGSRPVQIPGIRAEDPRIWDSTDALALKEIPKHLVIIGGGIIGMEAAEIYHGLGSEIIIVEMMKELIPPADRDLKQPLLSAARKKYAAIYTSTKLTGIEAGEKALTVQLEGKKAPASVEADAVLVAVGRKPNTDSIGIEHTGITLSPGGIIPTDTAMRSTVDHIYAIGDVTGNPMLAHKAVHQGKCAAEAASGRKSAFTPLAIPSVAYTSPEIAWVGMTENELKEGGIAYEKGSFPWQASGRALSEQAPAGVSKLLFSTETGRLIGAGITGLHAGELIAEAALAIEMGAAAEDIAQTIHPHPTLSETFALGSEIVDGSITDLLPR